MSSWYLSTPSMHATILSCSKIYCLSNVVLLYYMLCLFCHGYKYCPLFLCVCVCVCFFSVVSSDSDISEIEQKHNHAQQQPIKRKVCCDGCVLVI